MRMLRNRARGLRQHCVVSIRDGDTREATIFLDEIAGPLEHWTMAENLAARCVSPWTFHTRQFKPGQQLPGHDSSDLRRRIV